MAWVRLAEKEKVYGMAWQEILEVPSMDVFLPPERMQEIRKLLETVDGVRAVLRNAVPTFRRSLTVGLLHARSGYYMGAQYSEHA